MQGLMGFKLTYKELKVMHQRRDAKAPNCFKLTYKELKAQYLDL